MTWKKRSIVIISLGIVALFTILAQGQGTALAEIDPIADATSNALDKSLTFIDSSATLLGEGVLHVLNLITDDRVSTELTKPIGYLAFITILLILFGLVDVAKRIIWIGVIAGWVLLIVRIVLDAIGK